MNFDRIESALSFASNGFWRASWQASVLAIVVLLLQAMLGKRLGARGRYALWTIVLARLLLPALPPSPLSIYSFVDRITKETPSTSGPVVQQPETSDRSVAPALSASPLISRVDSKNAKSQAAIAGRARNWNLTQILALTWIAGAFVLTIRVLVSCIALQKTIRQLAPGPESLVRTVHASAQALRVRRIPEVRIGDSVRTPAVVGLIRPSLLLPASVLRQCGREEIRLIVMHELAHLKRWDLLANWLIAAATILHWFNPIVWLLAARMRSDREIACDELVLRRSQGDPRAAREYGLTLVRLIEILSPARNSALSGAQLVGILESTRPMQRRVRMIARFDASRRSSPGLWIAGVLVLLLGCAALTDSARGQAKPQDSRPVAPTTGPTLTLNAHYNLAAPSAGAQTDAELQERLRRVISEIRFDNIPFSDAIEFLRDQGAANLVVNWRALESVGIDKTAPVTIRLERVTIEQALQHMLKDIGGGNVALGFATSNGAIVVSTEEDLSRDVTTMFYDVHDLMVTSEGQALSGDQAEQKAQSLIKVISGTIASDSWMSAGGTVGSIEMFNGKLIVKQTPQNQEMIQQLLARLREKPTTQPRPLVP